MPESEKISLEQYMSNGVQNIVKNAIKATIKNPKEGLFWAKYAVSAKQAAKRRHELECKDEHVPSFLIASITQSCNLSCAGCYANANAGCENDTMTAEEWRRIFDEAESLGVSMILIGGGEPLTRPEVIKEAAEKPNIVFPIFTNGTMFDSTHLKMFEKHHNLVPIISIEGGKNTTDARRSEGVYDKTQEAMTALEKVGLLFGTSITVTPDNLEEVTQNIFIENLRKKGCRVVLFIEYVPINEGDIALSPNQSAILDERVKGFRQSFDDMIIISFPGDEKEAGGCLAAGRGFVHINASGGAEPCPFSPYSDTNVKEIGLRKALKSPLFTKLIDTGILQTEHSGGCVLFYRQDEVQQLISE